MKLRRWMFGAVVLAGLAGGRPGLALDAEGLQSKAEEALAAGHADEALVWIDKALERDPGSLAVWDLRTKWAQAAANRDELALSLVRAYGLAVAQKAPKKDLIARRAQVESVAPEAKALLDFGSKYVGRLAPFADQFEKQERRHAAIRIHQEILAIDPERQESQDAIERISNAPDPSLAETAKPKDLLADVSSQWIAEHDAKHATWDTASKLERANYITYTDCGYEVMVRTAEAMEHMNAFYRRFFHYGDDGKKATPRIAVRIFKGREEYLKLGHNPPEWSGGIFIGSAVETYVGEEGFAETCNTLFHEAAHQFVALATSASGWLNEGLASFMEGSRLLSNGTVKTNMPANHRLFPLATRMEHGWMSDPEDGVPKPGEKGGEPPNAPSFRMVVENKYEWGPPWYAPTWGVVYFLYDYQDPGDGRFVYRDAFHEFINSSGARVGKGAVENFEKVVLAHPAKPTPGFKAPEGTKPVALPKTIDELNAVWKDWILALRDEQSGRAEVVRPYLRWARCAIDRKDWDDATEHFENGVSVAPDDFDLCVEFAEHLAAHGRNPDRAVKLLLHAQRIAEHGSKPDPARAERVEKILAKVDPALREIEKIEAEMAKDATTLADACASAGLTLLTMDATRRFGADLNVPGMFERYEAALRKAPRSLAIWECAYNESNLRGWSEGKAGVYKAAGDEIRSSFGTYSADAFQFSPLILERTTSGDYSLESEVLVERGNGAFAGLVFGSKSVSAFHALVYFPGKPAAEAKEGETTSAYVDLTSFYGGTNNKILRHNALGRDAGGWHKMRADVSGPVVDVWFDGELVVSQEFSTADVLRGGFGLFCGPGEAHFRNVRFLARERGDPAAQIERKVVMEKMRAKGGAIGGSWLGQVPPFPEQVTWLKNPRKSWAEKGPVPTLVVFWSTKQDKKIPIRAWLQELDARYKDVGLEFVSVAGDSDQRKLETYLQYEPFPGAVCMDSGAGFGATFAKYSIGPRFNLPRLVLLDLDGKVVWEGDPGFKQDTPWQPGMPSYLDTPLSSLVDKRKLREIAAWRKAWVPRGTRAVDEGDFETAWPLLVKAADLPADMAPDVARAAAAVAKIREVTGSSESFAKFADTMSEAGREPVLGTLLDWSKSLKANIKLSPKTSAIVRGDAATAWHEAWHKAAAAAKSLPAGKEAEMLRALAGEFAAGQGSFVNELGAELTAALDKNDLEAAKRVCATAERRTGRWLLVEGFGTPSK